MDTERHGQQQQQLLHDPTLLNFVRKKQWKKARELVSKDPRAPYNANVYPNSEMLRLPLHELCRKVEFIDRFEEEEFSDDEDEDMFSNAERHTNKEMYKLAKYMIIQSQSLDTPIFHPNPTDARDDVGVLTIQRHRSILSLKDQNGNTPLHVLCSQCADTSMMKILLDNCPDESIPGEVSARAKDLVAARNVQGCTPLHFLAGGVCPFSAFQLFLQYCHVSETNDTAGTCDTRLIADCDGDIPLHWAFAAGTSPRRLRILLDGCYESLLCRNEEGTLPMEEFVEHHCDNWDFMDDDEKRALWNEIQEILKTVTNSRDDDTWSPLHAIASGVNFLPKIFWLIGGEFVEADTYNSDGMLPLHAAVSTPPIEYRGHSFPLYCDSERSLMREILFHNVELVKRPTSQGRLALHLAAESKQPEWVVSSLRNAFPDALTTLDPMTGLAPSILAAVDENNTLSTVYHLLRSDPSILRVRG